MNKRNNIVLIGMSGAGKTTVGRYISSRLGMKFMDTDDIIVFNTGKTIHDIFGEHGEKYFRDLENKVIESLKSNNGMVISTGGGVVLNKNNIDILNESGNIFLLDANIETLINNIKSSPKSKEHRPLLYDHNLDASIKELYNRRKELYFSSADYIIQVNNRTIEDIGSEIIYIFEQLNPCGYF